MPQFDHQRASVHYEIMGEGRPLLLIAGTASDGASWGPLLPLLPGRQLILIDNRGSGQTKVEGPITHDEMFDDAAALIAHLELGAVDVAGHSLGGWIGLGLAARHPDKVRRLVTMGIGPASRKSLAMMQDMARLGFTMVPQDWFRQFYQWLFSEPFFASEATVAGAAEASAAYAHRQSPGDFARQVAAMERGAQVDLTAITAPVLALAAELDLLAPPAKVAELHAPIRDHRVQVIAQAAHSIHWEKPAETAAAITAFLG